jgi:hypothetical protein
VAQRCGGANITPPRSAVRTVRTVRKRGSPEAEENIDLRDEHRVLQAQLNSALKHIENVTATVRVMDQKILQVCVERDQLRHNVDHLQMRITKLEKPRVGFLSYADFQPGGILADAVEEFTFFPGAACNNAFLDLINFTDGCDPGDGLCENIVRFFKVSIADRREFQRNEIMDIDNNAGRPRGRGRKLDWKTEWLVYNFYSQCGVSMIRVSKLFVIGMSLVHDSVYAWANVLCMTLEKFFPVPTRSQLLRSYPKSMIKFFCLANIFELLDATELGAEVGSMKTVNAILYSTYKHESTMKWLAACDPIGYMADDMIGAGHGVLISNPVVTAVSVVLKYVPFGMAVEVDKGFLIENECALLGINCIRPMKLVDKQTQQSSVDARLTQKVGKTRIVIEQQNGQIKQATNFFDKRIKINQLGLVDRIFRSSFLLQNFKLPFIQERSDNAATTNRPCKCEIRMYGATDDGLVDVRPEVELWGLDSEIDRWHVL